MPSHRTEVLEIGKSLLPGLRSRQPGSFGIKP
jgi:hypothetical protein